MHRVNDTSIESHGNLNATFRYDHAVCYYSMWRDLQTDSDDWKRMESAVKLLNLECKSMSWELAQLNIASLVAPLESPILADFVADLDRINAIADQSPGFVWRLQSEEGNATEVEHGFGDNVIANASVWESVEALHDYIYRTAHAQVMSRRKEWFERMTNAYMVLWWVPEGHRPTLREAQLKLQLLQSKGPSPEAFTFKTWFPKPSENSSREYSDI